MPTTFEVLIWLLAAALLLWVVLSLLEAWERLGTSEQIAILEATEEDDSGLQY